MDLIVVVVVVVVVVMLVHGPLVFESANGCDEVTVRSS